MKKLLMTLMCVAMVTAMMPTFIFGYTGNTSATLVNNADELLIALEKGEDVVFGSDIKIDPATLSNAYGATGINVKKGQSIDGAGFTLDITGAGGTWDSGISTTGGEIKNLKVTGSFRGVFVNHNSDHSEEVVLDNVIIDGTTYTISCDQGTGQNLTAVNSTFNGWTSYAETIGTVTFDNCNFGEGNGYAYMRPYASTVIANSVFEEGYGIDVVKDLTLINCYVGDTLVTEENKVALLGLGSDPAKTTVKNFETSVGEPEDLPTIDPSTPAEDVEIGTDAETKEVLKELSNEIVDSVLQGEAETDIVVEEHVKDAIRDAYANGEAIKVTTTVTAQTVTEEEIEDTDAVSLIVAKAGEDTVAQYLDLKVIMTVETEDGQVTGEVTELGKELTFTIAIPEALQNTEEGVTREFYIIRVHNGVAETLEVTVNEDGTLSFTTDRFSTYALAYTDTVEEQGDENNETPTPEGTTPDGTVPEDTEQDDVNKEEPKNETSNKTETKDKTETANAAKEVAPDTGNTSNLMVWIAIMMAAAAMAVVLKRREN